MFNLEQYISSGVIESYCLGNLPAAEARILLKLASEYPELQIEIDETLAALEKYKIGQTPPRNLKDRTLNYLDPFLTREKIDLNDLPVITKHSDAYAWQAAIKDLLPEHEYPDFSIRNLKQGQELEINLVWLHQVLVEDQHSGDDFTESFLILEGACECDFEGHIVRFGAGDYFEVPAGVRHVIKNISEPEGFVKGIVQRRKAA
ncbi:MAG: cupin domain-containing protein [Saprospiraceae bacterium]|nr:cupin domain-containing protein [Saprospiraceae bacterium]